MFSGRPIIGMFPNSIASSYSAGIDPRASTLNPPIYTPNLSASQIRERLDMLARQITTSMEKLRILKKENLYAQLDSIGASQKEKHVEFIKIENEGLDRLAAFTGIYESTNNPNLPTLSKFSLLDNYLKNLREEINTEEIKFKLTEAYRKAREVLKHVDLIVRSPVDAEKLLKELNLYFANNDMANIQNMSNALDTAIDKGIKERNAKTKTQAETQAKQFEAEIIAEETTETLYNEAISLWAEVYSISKDDFNADKDFETLDIAKNSLDISSIKKLISKLSEQKRDINKTLYSAYEDAINSLKEIARLEKSEEKALKRRDDFDEIYKTKNLKKILLAVDKLKQENHEICLRGLVLATNAVVAEMKDNDNDNESVQGSGYEASDEEESPKIQRIIPDKIHPDDIIDDEDEEAIAEIPITQSSTIPEIKITQSSTIPDDQTKADYPHLNKDGSDAVEVELMPMGNKENENEDETYSPSLDRTSYVTYISGSQPPVESPLRIFGSEYRAPVDDEVTNNCKLKK